MSFLNSDDVRIFPSSTRTGKDGVYTSEKNLTNILKSIVNRKSYLVEEPIEINNKYLVRVVINGYYFEINNFSKPFGASELQIKTITDKSLLTTYDGGEWDENDHCNGINYLTSDLHSSDYGEETSGEYTIYYLKLTNQDGDWNTNSYAKINMSSIEAQEDKTLGEIINEVVNKIDVLENKTINGTQLSTAGDITTQKWGSTRGFNISQTANDSSVNVDGSQDVTLNLPTELNGFTKITSTTFEGKATSAGEADKLGNSTVGGLLAEEDQFSTQNIYLLNGAPKPISKITFAKMNGSTTPTPPANPSKGDIFIIYND